MNPFEFLSFEPISGEKIFGIVTIRAWGKIIIKFRVIPKKDGTPFASVPTFKNGLNADGGDKYDKVFIIDSAYEKKMLDDLIEKNLAGKVQNQAIQNRPVYTQPPIQNNQQNWQQTGNPSHPQPYLPNPIAPLGFQSNQLYTPSVASVNTQKPGEYLGVDGKWHTIPQPEAVPY